MTAASDDPELISLLLEQADRLLRGEVTREILARADAGEFPQALWDACEAAGLPLALVPEAGGGVGLSIAQGLRLVRQLGYHAAPLPLPETMLARMLWHEAGGADVDGILTLAPAAEPLALTTAGGAPVLSGNVQRVPWGGSAAHVLVPVRDAQGDEHLLLAANAQARVDALRNLAFEPRDTLTFETVVDGAMLRPVVSNDGASMFALGALLRAQQMAGAMERCLDHALTYAMERQQFGRPIAKFQAIQHMLAEAAGHYAAAVAAADLATDAWRTPQFEFCVAIAKARVGEAAGKIAAIVHQVHGAMGFTQEHPLHFSTRRLWSWRDEFGSEAYWQECLGRQVCGAGGAALWPMLTDD